MKNLLGFLFSLTFVLSAKAQLNTDNNTDLYRFSRGNCQSQGSWTASAIGQTANLRTIIQKIANDPDCTGLAKSLEPSVNAEESTIQGPKGSLDESQASDNSQTFTQALYNEATPAKTSTSPNSSAVPKSSLVSSLMDNTIKSSLYNLNSASSIGSAVQKLNTAVGASSRTMDAALTIYDQLASTLSGPAFKQCLIKRADIGTAVLAGVIKLGAAFSSSGAGVMDHWGSTTARIANLMRNNDIAEVLKKNGNADLTISMSCLLESTSQAFCSARDAQNLLDTIQDHHRQPGQTPFQVSQVKAGKVGVDSPLAGYYILTQHLPNVSSWIQQILLSAEPQYTADGNRMASALDNVNNFLKSLWVLKGTYRENINTMMTSIGEADLKGRQNSLLSALVNLINNMNVSQTTDPTVIVSGAGLNFFTQSMQGYDIPFFLIDSPTPPEVVVNALGQKTDWSTWISKDNFAGYTQFSDPVKLAATIDVKLKELMKIALVKASNYYRNRIIVNKEMVVGKTLLDMPYSAKTSLRYIYLYLDNFQKLLENYGDQDSQEMIPSVRNTKYKIATVLGSYKILDDIKTLDPAEKNPKVLKALIDKYDIKDVDPEKDNGSILIMAAYEKVLQTAYDQFDILLQRDSFLTSSLSTYIYADYVLKTQNKLGMDQYTDDLLMATGQNLMNLMAQVHGIPPNQVAADLHNAQVINKTNLMTVEQFFRDTLLTSLERTTLTAHNIEATDNRVNLSIANRLFRDVMSGNTFSDNPWATSFSFLKGLLVAPAEVPNLMLERKKLRPDLYPFDWSTTQNLAPKHDTEKGDFANQRNLICIQVLAFEDRKFFNEFCSDRDPQTGKRVGIVLQSPQISPTEKNPALRSLDVRWDQYMYNGLANKPVTSDSICAYRDFNRRGLVYWLTQNTMDVPNPKTLMPDNDTPNPKNPLIQDLNTAPQVTKNPLDPHINVSHPPVFLTTPAKPVAPDKALLDRSGI